MPRWAAVLLVARAFANAEDPGATGPLAVSRQQYNYGETAFTPPDFPGPVEVLASVQFPTDLKAGPFPLVLFLHGRHATCYQGTTAFLEWPCSPERQIIPSYQGYDYAAGILASHGYIVVSISANGINARDNSVVDLGALARAQLIQHHLDIWNTFNTIGGPPFGDQFVGKVDLTHIGTMGHSRGGEGVVRHYLLNAGQESPYGVTAVLPLAAADFSRPVINNVALAVPLSYCDGDLSDLPGVHFFDDARYNVPGDGAPKHTILIMGANHNFFNTVWTPGEFPAGTADDWLEFVPGGAADTHCGTVAGNQRLTPARQRGALAAYLSAFFRTYLGGEYQFFPYLQGDLPPPPSAMTDQIHVSYHPPDDPSLRLDVNRMLDGSSLAVNSLGGAVIGAGLKPYDVCGGQEPEPQHCLPGQPPYRQPHTAPSPRSDSPGLSQLRLGWDETNATYENYLPDGSRDVSAYSVLQFRASVNFADDRNTPGTPQDLAVILAGGSGNSATVHASDFSSALYYPPGRAFPITPVPKVFLNTVRIPLGAFAGIDLTDVQSIQFAFDQPPQGALLISDIAFAGMN
jgi:hypothetical protein